MPCRTALSGQRTDPTPLSLSKCRIHTDLDVSICGKSAFALRQGTLGRLTLVEPGDQVLDAADTADGTARNDLANHVPLSSLVLLHHLKDEPEQLKDRDDQRPEGDRAERQGRAPDERLERCALRQARTGTRRRSRAVVIPSCSSATIHRQFNLRQTYRRRCRLRECRG